MEAEKDIFFSLIVAAYNVDTYIRECIDSILMQTYKGFEVWVIDDGSTDETGNICDELAKKFGSLHIVHQENGGLSAARNSGLRRALGEYILFVDGDDYIDPMTLQKFRDCIIENHFPQVVVADAWRIRENIKERKMPPRDHRMSLLSGNDFMEKSIKRREMSVCVPFNAYQKKFLVMNNFYFKEGILHEDLWWTPQVFMSADKVIYGNFLFYNHRERPGSITSCYSVKNVRDMQVSCYELRNNPKAGKWLKDFLAQNYMSACFLARQDIQIKGYCVDRDFPIQNAYSIRNRLKAILFWLSPAAYAGIDKILKQHMHR